jgi:hypothetical protein
MQDKIPDAMSSTSSFDVGHHRCLTAVTVESNIGSWVKAKVALVKVNVQVMIHRKSCTGFGCGQGHSQSREGSMVWGNPWSGGINKPHERVESNV